MQLPPPHAGRCRCHGGHAGITRQHPEGATAASRGSAPLEGCNSHPIVPLDFWSNTVCIGNGFTAVSIWAMFAKRIQIPEEKRIIIVIYLATGSRRSPAGGIVNPARRCLCRGGRPAVTTAERGARDAGRPVCSTTLRRRAQLQLPILPDNRRAEVATRLAGHQQGSVNPIHLPCRGVDVVIPNVEIVDPSHDFGGWYRASGYPGEATAAARRAMIHATSHSL